MPKSLKKIHEQININGIEIELIRSKRRSLSLEVGNQGIKIRAPMRISTAVIIEFVNSKHQWLQQRLDERPAPLEKIELVSGAQLSLYGNPIVLNVLENKRGSARLEDDQLLLPVSSGSRPSNERIRNKLIQFYKSTAISQLQKSIEEYAPKMSVEISKPAAVKVREYKRRWGSCDSDGNLSFNWRIIMAPSQVLDYVVIHELAHHHEFNHSKRFWNHVEQQMPDWKDKHDWLQNNGSLLYRF